MPFLKGGQLAITRTTKYLNAGQLVLNDAVKIVAINHMPGNEISNGCSDFIKWFLPPLQFKNPNVQIITFKNMCPTPFIKVYLTNDEEVVVNCSYRGHREIHEQMIALFNKSVSTELSNKYERTKNPANFGTIFERECICEVYGQVPCSSHQGRPKPWPGLEPDLPVIDSNP